MEFVDLRIVSRCSKEELIEFLRLCMKIQYLGCVGSSRSIKVHVDGDGSGSLLFYTLDKNGKGELLPTPKFKDADEREAFTTDMMLFVGETIRMLPVFN